jgi:hypothetical protein
MPEMETLMAGGGGLLARIVVFAFAAMALVRVSLDD